MSLWNMFELVILFFSSPIFEGLDIWLHFSMCQCAGIGFKIPIPCLDYDRIGNKEGLLT